MNACPLTDRYVHLDALRALAAFLVLAGHARGFVIVDFSAVSGAGVFAQALYFATSLGHQAVMVFFALSGFLIGAQVLTRMAEGTFLWRVYLLRRLTRLWIVVLPALVLTFCLDRLGMASSSAAGYQGEWYSLLSSGPQVFTDHSVATFLGNLAFLQTITVPVFGSNGPLWSLANEFWYYIAFPLLAGAALLRVRAAARILLAVAAIGLLLWLPWWLVQAGLIWVAGAAFGWLALQPRFVAVARRWYFRVLAALVACAALAVGRFSGIEQADLILGVLIAACLPALALLTAPRRGLYLGAATFGSAISYTLYLTHFPLLAAIWFGLIAPDQWTMATTGILVVVALCAAAIVWAILVWWCFERNTDRVFRWLLVQSARPFAVRRAPMG